MKLAIIILSGDTPEVLFRCLTGIKQNIEPKYKVYLGYNGKSTETEQEIRGFLEATFPPESYKFIKYEFYNFSILNNDIVNNHLDSDSEHLLFCNNDVIISTNCVNEMVHVMTTSSVPLGTIGCRLIYEDGTIQHDGQVIFAHNDGTLKAVSHLNLRASTQSKPYSEVRLVIGNTFALCLCTLEAFRAVGGLNEEYKICFEDVEFNLRCLQQGYKNVTLPSRFWAHHLESYTRKNTPEKGAVTMEDYGRLHRFFSQRFINGIKLICVTAAPT
jgi:hypothetical protein